MNNPAPAIAGYGEPRDPALADPVSLPDASPETLRELHAVRVRQLRNSARTWVVVCAAAAALLVWTGAPPGGGAWLVLGLVGFQAFRSTWNWNQERHSDPLVVDGSARAALERERDLASAFNARLTSFRAYATASIAGALSIVTFFALLTAASLDVTVARAGLVKPLVSEGEWWRLGTAVFVHAGPWHFVANVSVLMTFGRIVEARSGRAVVLLVFAVSGLVGSLASWWLIPDTASLGASGAVMGVVGFLAVLGWRRPDDVPESIRQRVFMAMLATALVGAMAFGLIDNAAHAGGAVAGVLIAMLVVPPQTTASSRATDSSRMHIVLASAAGVAIAVTAGRAALAVVGGPAGLADIAPSLLNTVRPVASVSAHLERGTSGPELVITNRGVHALEAYDITVSSAGSKAHVWRDDCCYPQTGRGPIPAGGSARIPLSGLQFDRRIRPALEIGVLMFGDGAYEGSIRIRDELVRRRRDVVAEATYWIGALDSIRTAPPTAVTARLIDFARSRARYSDVSQGAFTAFGIERLMLVEPDQSVRAADEIERVRAAIVASKAALTTRLKF